MKSKVITAIEDSIRDSVTKFMGQHWRQQYEFTLHLGDVTVHDMHMKLYAPQTDLTKGEEIHAIAIDPKTDEVVGTYTLTCKPDVIKPKRTRTTIITQAATDARINCYCDKGHWNEFSPVYKLWHYTRRIHSETTKIGDTFLETVIRTSDENPNRKFEFRTFSKHDKSSPIEWDVDAVLFVGEVK